MTTITSNLFSNYNECELDMLIMMKVIKIVNQVIENIVGTDMSILKC